MGHDRKDPRLRTETRLAEARGERPAAHVVFDFTGLDQLDVGDLSLILTARLQSAPTDWVWVRSLPLRTARVLRALGLDHYFRPYPTAGEQLH